MGMENLNNFSEGIGLVEDPELLDGVVSVDGVGVEIPNITEFDIERAARDELGRGAKGGRMGRPPLGSGSPVLVTREPLITEPIWQRQPGESDKCWAAFEHWLQMDVRGRTQKQVAAELRYLVRTIRIWWVRWSWDARGRAYSAFLFSQAEDERIAQIRRLERKRSARLEQLEEQLWVDYELLEAKAKVIMNLPVVEERHVREEVGPDGRTIQHIYEVKPVRATLAMATQMMETAMKLAQTSLGMPTQRIALQGESRPEGHIDNMDMASLDEHIEALKKRQRNLLGD